ncbi:MAG: family 43 glycosylhydrolase [Bacteroidota bacterium]
MKIREMLVKQFLKVLLMMLLEMQWNWAVGQNPIIPNQGVNDPHIRILNGKAYLSATHDKSVDNTSFVMEDWWLWSSDDLVHWQLESVLKPEDTYIGKPFSSCWATDIAYRNGKYYWYFSEANERTGVVVSDSPKGPWKDPLGKPLLDSGLTPTHEYDVGLIQDEEGEYYIVFGVWDYYIARLNEDMISLAEKPRKITINNPQGPYNQDGENKKKPTDDKPFIHFRNGYYYLSWGCFYAMSDSPYGPYDYKGSVINKSSFTGGLDSPTWPNGFLQGRHGSFFEWHDQSYFAYCDISQTGNRYFRDTFISYIHYKQNGEMASVRVDVVGVGRYDFTAGLIEAEDYYKSSGVRKVQNTDGDFLIGYVDDEDYLIYPNIEGLEKAQEITLSLNATKDCQVEFREGDAQGRLVKRISVKKGMTEISATGNFKSSNLCVVFNGKGGNLLELDKIIIK